MRGIEDIDGRDVGLFVVVLGGWLEEGEHVSENGGAEGEDELMDAEAVR